MNMFRTTARLSLAALSVSLGATFTTAADKKPNQPVAKVQGHAAGKPVQPTTGTTTQKRQHEPLVAKKPNGFSWGMSYPPPAAKPQTTTNDLTKKPNRGAVDDWSFPGVKAQRDSASGLPTGRTKPSNLGDTGTHEVGHVKAPKIDPKNAKPINNGGGEVSAQNDAGTRSGTSLTIEGVVDMVKGVGKFLSPKGNTHEGMEQTAKGWAKVKTGTNGDPSDNGDKLTEEGKGGGENNGGNNNNGGSGGGSSSGGSGSGSGGSGT